MNRNNLMERLFPGDKPMYINTAYFIEGFNDVRDARNSSGCDLNTLKQLVIEQYLEILEKRQMDSSEYDPDYDAEESAFLAGIEKKATEGLDELELYVKFKLGLGGLQQPRNPKFEDLYDVSKIQFARTEKALRQRFERWLHERFLANWKVL